jgi:general secretion pathway protein D
MRTVLSLSNLHRRGRRQIAAERVRLGVCLAAVVLLLVALSPADALAGAPGSFGRPGGQPVPAPIAPPAAAPIAPPVSALSLTLLPAELYPAPPFDGVMPALPPATGEKPITPPPARKPLQGPITLNFKDASLRSVLTYLSEAAGLIIVEVAPVDARVTVMSLQPLSVDEAVGLLNTVLKEKGFAAVRTGRTLKIVTLTDAKKAAVPVRSGGDPAKIEPTDEVVTQIIPVQFADAAQLKVNLTTLIPTYADLQANVATNSLILTATQTDVRRIVEIVHSLDSQEVLVSEVKVFALQYANASNAARLINDLFNGSSSSGTSAARPGGLAGFLFGGAGGGGGGGRGGGGGGPGGGGGGGDRGGGGGSDSASAAGPRQQKVTASADDRTNTLVVSAPSDLLKVIEGVIKQLDANPTADQAVFTYRLKNANSSNLEAVINNLFGASTSAAARTGTTTGRTGTTAGTSGTGRTTGTGGTTGRGGSTGFGSGSSSSSMRGLSSGSSGLGSSSFGSSTTSRGGTTASTAYRGTTTSGARLSSSAAQSASDLSGQVFVVADTDTNSLLVTTGSNNWPRVRAILDELDRAVPQVLIKVLIAEVTHEKTEDLGLEASILNLTTAGVGFKVGTNFSVAAQTQGLVFRLIQDNVTAALHAIAGAGKLDVLSRPYILTSDNQQASIMVGQSVPLITSSMLTSTGETINSISYNDLGIILTVTPHINPDGLVIMDVYQEISAFTGQSVQISDTLNAPVYAKRVAQSRVAIRDAQTIVIGGLMEDRNTDHVDKVPFLGDIPGIGVLFQHTTKDKIKTELLLFLTPHVARVPDDLTTMSEGEMAGSKVIQGAVEPGAFDDHMKGMRQGAAPPPEEESNAPATEQDEATPPAR